MIGVGDGRAVVDLVGDAVAIFIAIEGERKWSGKCDNAEEDKKGERRADSHAS